MPRHTAGLLDLQDVRRWNLRPLRNGLRADATQLADRTWAAALGDRRFRNFGQADSSHCAKVSPTYLHVNGSYVDNGKMGFHDARMEPARRSPASPPDPDRGARFRAAREEKGWTQESLSLRLGVSRVAITQWERGDMPEAWRWPKIADQLEKSLDWLVLGRKTRRSDHIAAYAGELSAGVVDIAKTAFASIGRYDASLSAGPGSIIDPHAEPLGYQLVEMSWLQTLTKAKPHELALLRVDGDSMSPTLEHSDWVLIDRTQTRISREGIYALAVGDDAWIKRITLDLAEKKVRIISDNTKYPPQLLSEEDLRLIGRYVALVWRRSRT